MPADDRSAEPREEVALLDARRIALAMSELEARCVQALTARVLDGRPRSGCATFFGISLQAFDVMLLRAIEALEGVASPGLRRPALPFEHEQRRAEALSRALDTEVPPAGMEVARLHGALLHLRELAGPIKGELDALEQAREASPRARWERLLRRVLVVLLIAAALYLYGLRGR